MLGRVCIGGSVNMDLVVRAPSLPAPGETIAGLSTSNKPDDLAAALLARGPRAVIITLGSKGAIVADAEGVKAIPSIAVEAIPSLPTREAVGRMLYC